MNISSIPLAISRFLMSGILILCLNPVIAQTWTSIGFTHYGGTRTLAIDSITGIVYVGGSFSPTGNVTQGIARRIGSTWDSLGSGMNGDVLSIIMFNGELYAGGYFTTAGGDSANYVARWDGLAWHPLGDGMNGAVFSLTVLNNELYAAGNFTTADGVSANYIAKWNGTSWSALGSGCNGIIWDIIAYNGSIYAGGFFTSAGGSPALRLAKWDGVSWSAMGSGADDLVQTFGVHEGSLYLGGSFTHVDGISANHIAKWDGTVFSPLGTGVDDFVEVIASYNCELYAGGNFLTAGGIPVDRFAKYNDKGGWSAIPLPFNASALYVDAMMVYNNNLYAAGNIPLTNGNVQIWNLAVPAPPVAAFTASQTNTHYGEYLQFNSTGANAVNYKWSFPGGIPSSSTEKSPKIFYPAVGDFDVSLIVYNCMGIDTIDSLSCIHIDSLAHAIPVGNSSDFITITSPPNASYFYGDYNVFYYKPANYDSLTSPILFYIHGQGGTGAGNTDLHAIADRQNAMIVSPTMRANYGYVRDLAQDNLTGCWYRVFLTEVFKQIYRHVLTREQRPSIDAYLTGFSEGGQFTTRYMLIRQFSPDSIPIKMAVSVSPANYTLMTDTFNNAPMDWLNYRCGLAGFDRFVFGCSAQQDVPVSTFICNEHIIQYYNENYGILVGMGDTVHFSSFCGYATGTDRFDRAKVFHTFSTTDAIARGTSLQWVFDSVPIVAHSNYWMYNEKKNQTDTFTIAENMLFNTPLHNVPQLTPTCIPTGNSNVEIHNLKLIVYPNPAAGIFYFDLPIAIHGGNFRVYNSLGQEVHLQKTNAGSNRIDLSNLREGVYFYALDDNEEVIHRGKLIKE